MAGLSVLLDTTTAQHKQQYAGAATRTSSTAQVISKATFLNAAAPKKIWVSPAFSSTGSSYPSRAATALPATTTASCSFLQRCFLCRRDLPDGVDIYIYRGDRAFCSEECRCRHILVDDDDDGAMDCAGLAAAGRSRRRDVADGFAF